MIIRYVYDFDFIGVFCSFIDYVCAIFACDDDADDDLYCIFLSTVNDLVGYFLHFYYYYCGSLFAAAFFAMVKGVFVANCYCRFYLLNVMPELMICPQELDAMEVDAVELIWFDVVVVEQEQGEQMSCSQISDFILFEV